MALMQMWNADLQLSHILTFFGFTNYNQLITEVTLL